VITPVIYIAMKNVRAARHTRNSGAPDNAGVSRGGRMGELHTCKQVQISLK
jgi:hypothetical protein